MNPKYIKFIAQVFAVILLITVVVGLSFPVYAAPGGLTRVSVDSSGAQANGGSWRPTISGDGRYVAFTSDASNLVSGDTNNKADIFIHDRWNGKTTRISVNTHGVEANGGSDTPSISNDGNFVAFYSDASNLVNGDTNGIGDIFLHDRQTGRTTRVSVDSNGNEANGENSDYSIAISGDGRYVAFPSDATNLVSGDTNGVRDIFIHDNQTGKTRRVSVASNGVEANRRSRQVDISDDGRYVAFESEASNLIVGETNGLGGIFVHDLQTGETTRVSVNTHGDPADGGGNSPSISGDGRYVAFLSGSGNLDPRGFEYYYHGLVYVRDRQLRQTILATVDSGGGILTMGMVDEPTISSNGRYVAFSFYDKGDNNGIMNIWVRDLQTGESIRVSGGSDSSYGPSLSADGSVVAFSSRASMVSGDTNGVGDVFVREVTYGPDRNPTVAFIAPDCDFFAPPWHCPYPTPSSLTFFVIFSEPVTGVTADDFSLQMLDGRTDAPITPHASITGVSGVGYEYFVTVDIGTGETEENEDWLGVTVVDDDSIKDSALNPLGGIGAGNGNFGKGDWYWYWIDKTIPVVTSIVRADPNPTAAAEVHFTVNFSEAVHPVRADDFVLTTTGSISGTTVTAISPREDEYIETATFTVTVNTGTGDGTLRLDLIDDDTIGDWDSMPPLGGKGAGNGDFTTGEAYTIDRNVPSVPSVTSVIRADVNPTDAASVNFTVIFSEAVSGVDPTDFSLATTGNISGALVTNVSGSGNTYMVTVSTGSGAGDLRLDVADDDSILSLLGSPLGGPGVGNGNFTSGEAYTINKNVPAVVSSLRTDVNPTNAHTVHFNVTFSEAVSNVDISDFVPVVTGSVTGVFVSEVNGVGNAYTVSVDVEWGDGTLRLDVPAGATITDMDGNLPVGLPYSSGESYSIDNTAPTVASSARASLNDPTNLPSVDFIVTFSEPVQGVDASDFVSGAAVSGGPVVYTVSINTDGDGYLPLQLHGGTIITDLVGNSFVAGLMTVGEAYRIDKTAPALSSSLCAGPNPTNAASVDFTITFSESVTGVDTGDFVLTKTGTITGESVGGVSGGPTVYTVTVNTGTGDGTLRLDLIDNDSIVDLAFNPLGGVGPGNGNFTSGETYVIDKAAPAVISILRTDENPTSTAGVHFNVTFSEPVSGVDAGDFTLTVTGGISGAAITSVDSLPGGSGNVYTVTVTTGSGEGTIRLDVVDNDSILDAGSQPLGGSGAGNGNFTSGEAYAVYKVVPIVTDIVRPGPNPTQADSARFIVTFSEAVTGVDASDFTLITTGDLSRAFIISLSGSANTYTVTVSTGIGNGTLRLDLIDNDSIVDSANQPLGGVGAGNGNFTTGGVYTINKSPRIMSEIFRSSGSSDGWVLESAENSGQGGSFDSASQTFNLGDDEQNRQYRSILSFPTQHLPDNAVITTAILMIRKAGAAGTDPFMTHQNITIDIQSGYFGSGGLFGTRSLDSMDFQWPASKSSVGTITNNPVDGWYWAVLDNSAYQFINLRGMTQLRLMFQLDDDNDQTADYLTFFSGNDKKINDRPRLYIEYYIQK